jgi:nucleotide-binding universal stress UspA family protein
MVRSVLVGLDGSAYSDSAVALGIDWARRFDALVVGLGIVDKPSIFQPEMVPLGADAYKQPADEARLARATRQVEQFLEKFSLRCAEAGVSSKVLEDVGNPYEQILREAQRYDVILLGKQTYFHFATQEGPCETLKSVLKNTPRPVVTVPGCIPVSALGRGAQTAGAGGAGVGARTRPVGAGAVVFAQVGGT